MVRFTTCSALLACPLYMESLFFLSLVMARSVCLDLSVFVTYFKGLWTERSAPVLLHPASPCLRAWGKVAVEGGVQMCSTSSVAMPAV